MATQQNVSNNVHVYLGGPPMTGIKYPAARGNNLASGNNDLYTVPANKRAMIASYSSYNQSGGTIIFFTQIKIGGVYYRVEANISLGTLGTASSSTTPHIFLEAAESIAVNTDLVGLNINYKVIEFDATVPVKTIMKLASWASGDNTLYTVPAGKTAILLDTLLNLIGGVSTLAYCDMSGGTVNIIWHLVPSGGSPGATNLAAPLVAVANNVKQMRNGIATLNAGDFVNINVDSITNTQIAWINVIEI